MPFDGEIFSVRTMLCLAGVIYGHFGCSGNSSVPSVGIQVIAGTYGGNCHASHGNVTSRLAAACNGKTTCNYTITVAVLTDPAPGCAKEYTAEWTCGDSPAVKQAKAAVKPEDNNEAGFGSVVTLRCDANQ